METNGTSQPQPTPEEAAAALGEVQAAQNSLRAVPLPWWHFPALSLLGLFPLINLVKDDLALFLLALAAWFVLLFVVLRVLVGNIGVQEKVRGRTIWPPLALGVALLATASAIEFASGDRWGWVAFSALWIGATLAFGARRARIAQKSA